MNKTIGNILIELGIITPEQLQQCQTGKEESGQTVTECLLENKIISELALAQALAQYAGVRVVETVADNMTQPELLIKIPLTFLRENNVMPVLINGQQFILTANPLDFQPIDNISLLLGGNVQYAVAPRSVIAEAINRFYPIGGTQEMIEELEEEGEEAVDFGDVDEKDILGMASEAPVIKLVNHILFQAVKRGASDIHIEPFEKELVVRYRIDGVMHHVMMPPKRIQSALSSRIKIMANLNIAEKRIPQDGRIQIKVADKAIDIRVSILPVAYGERVVMRLLDKSRTFSDLEKLGLSERDLRVLMKGIEQPNGIVFVTGPTGSGKTTTLYSVLARLNRPDVNVITVEDPVEYQMSGIGQVQVREKIGLTFAASLRSILRQDPDIVMIGEIRDQETAQIAIQAALTGHLVLSTLHTNSAPATITRLLDMGIEPFLIASSITLAMAQRLVRRLCDHCKKPYTPPQEMLNRLGLSAQEVQGITFYDAIGCEECLNSGYRGRFAIFEVMEITNALARLIMDRVDTSVLRQQAVKDGMTLLFHDGIRRIKEGVTTLEEVLSVAAAQQEDVV